MAESDLETDILVYREDGSLVKYECPDSDTPRAASRREHVRMDIPDLVEYKFPDGDEDDTGIMVHRNDTRGGNSSENTEEREPVVRMSRRRKPPLVRRAVSWGPDVTESEQPKPRDGLLRKAQSLQNLKTKIPELGRSISMPCYFTDDDHPNISRW